MRPRNGGGACRGVIAVVLCSCFIMTVSQAQDANAPVARVNGEVISQRELVNRLIADYGDAVLEQLILELLVEQEAKRLRIEVADKEVEQRIRRQAAQLPPGTTLEEALRKQNPPMSVATYREVMRMFLRVEKMVAKEVIVSEAEVTRFLTQRPDLAQQPEQVEVEGLVVRDKKLADDLYQEAAKRNQDLTKLARLYTDRDQKVDRVELGWQPVGVVPGIPTNARTGFVAPPHEAAPGIFWIYRVIDRQAARRKSLDEARKDAHALLLELKLAEVATRRLEQIRAQHQSQIQRTLPKGN